MTLDEFLIPPPKLSPTYTANLKNEIIGNMLREWNAKNNCQYGMSDADRMAFDRYAAERLLSKEDFEKWEAEVKHRIEWAEITRIPDNVRWPWLKEQQKQSAQ